MLQSYNFYNKEQHSNHIKQGLKKIHRMDSLFTTNQYKSDYYLCVNIDIDITRTRTIMCKGCYKVKRRDGKDIEIY